MKRRRYHYGRIFVFLLVCATVLYGFWRVVSSIFSMGIVSLMDKTGDDSKLGVKQVRQLVVQDNTTGRTIMFASEAKGSYGIEYRIKGEKSPSIIAAKDVSFKDGKEKYIQYVAKLEKLRPGTKYEYRVVKAKETGEAKDAASAKDVAKVKENAGVADGNAVKFKDAELGSWHQLETDDRKGFKAMIFADAQSGGDYKEWIGIADKAYSDNKNAKLYLNLGDQVDCGAHGYQWRRWFEGIKPFGADIPMASLIGNHELYTLNFEEGYPTSYLNLFYLPSAMEKYKHQFYSFDYGPVHFVVLDTNHRDEMVKYQPNLADAQIAWLRQDLANSKAKWKVALMHRDILMYRFSQESGRPCGWQTYIDYSGRDFMPIFDQYKVDAVLSGHLHSYRRRVPLKRSGPDPKGITYIMLGVAGNQSYGNLWADFEWDAKRSPDRKDPGGYMTMDVNDERLILKAFMPDGKEFDEVTLKK